MKNKILVGIMCIICIAESLETTIVSAHERNLTIETDKAIAKGVLEDGTPYVIYEKQLNGDKANIVDSRNYEIKVTFPWGTTPPKTFNVSVSIKGMQYKGTLNLNVYLNNFMTSTVDAYYKGVIFGVI
jgi:hypothetical protein